MTGAVVCWILGAAAVSAQTPAVVRAEAFELLDARGIVRARLEVDRGNGTAFLLRDAQGADRIGMLATAEVGGLQAWDTVGRPGITIQAGDGGPIIEAAGIGGSTALVVSTSGTAGLVVLDRAGQARAAAGIDTNSAPQFRAFSAVGGLLWQAP